jgi:F-type H+-transporting ATPase subunit b
MRRAWAVSPLLTLSLALLPGGADARAADPPGGHTPPVYEVDLHDPVTHKPTTREFDLNKLADAEELTKAIREGHVHGLHLKEPITLKKLFSLSAELGIWSLVVFGLLLFVLSRIAWPKMLEGLRKREENIRGALDEAQKARDEAHASRLALQKQMDEAHTKVKEILDEGRRDAQALRESEMAKTRAEIQAERDRLQREIETQTDQALQKIWTQAAELATQVSAKALGRGISEDGHRKLIDEAVSELRDAATRGNGHA